MQDGDEFRSFFDEVCGWIGLIFPNHASVPPIEIIGELTLVAEMAIDGDPKLATAICARRGALQWRQGAQARADWNVGAPHKVSQDFKFTIRAVDAAPERIRA
jgi:hypothetical protein